MGVADFKKVNDSWYGGEDRGNLNKFYANDAPSTGKKKKKKRSVKKADHKHDYYEVILREDLTYSYVDHPIITAMRGRRCKICGEIKVDGLFSERESDGCHRMLEYDEIIAKYPDLEIIEGKWL